MNIILILKGFIIGTAKIIPGVSGSVLAVSLGVYEKIINSISSVKNIKNNFNFLLNFSLGFLLSIILVSGIISYFINNYYVYTMILFLGFIIGTIPPLISFVKIKSKKDIFILLLFILLPFFIHGSSSSNYIYLSDLKNNLYVMLLGFIDAFSTIIPGISGTAIFMLMGCYNFILFLFSNMYKILYSTDYIMLYIFFIFGLLFGIIIISKLMSYLLKHYHDTTFIIIMGLSISSIILLFISFYKYLLFKNILYYLLLFIIGFYLSKSLNNI